MKFSKRILLNLKIKTKNLKPDKYRRLKRESLRGCVKGTSKRPRLSVYRSNSHMYVQLINDDKSETILSCSTLDREFKLLLKNGCSCIASEIMGKKLAELCLKKKIPKIIFDRNIYIYHGRVKTVAESARKYGLEF